LKEYTTLHIEYDGILNKNTSKFIKWLVKLIYDTPSKMYIVNQSGGLSNYCLNVGQAIDNLNYLSITKCSNAKYLFKYGNVPFNDENGTNL